MPSRRGRRDATGDAPGMKATRPTLLVVDDEAEVLHSVHDLLRLDYRVLTCETRCRGGARSCNPSEDIHVVMSDQRMPGMTGVEVLRHARAAQARGHPPALHGLRRHQGGRRRDQSGERLPLHLQALGPRRTPGGRPSGGRTARPDRRKVATPERAEGDESATRRGQPPQERVHRGRQSRAEHPGDSRCSG